MQITRKNMKWLFSIFVIIFVFQSCMRQKQYSHRKGERSNNQYIPIVFALDWTSNTNHTGVYVAKKLKYFQELGLEVKVQFGQTSASHLVMSQNADFAISSQELATAAIANQKAPIISIATILQKNTTGFTSLTSKGIRSPKDFHQKIYGSWGGEFEVKILKDLIQSAKSKSIHITNIFIGEANLAGLLESKIDFAWTYFAWQNIKLELQGFKTNFMPLRSLNPLFDYYTPIIITSKVYLKQNPDIISQFLAALSKGYIYAAKHPQVAAKILLQYAPELDKTLVFRSQEYISPIYLNANHHWGKQKEAIWSQLSTWMLKNKLLDQKVTAKQAMTNKYLPDSQE